jgi:MinD-like ATPase involved in chromosome partitioning or flagellar assembly
VSGVDLPVGRPPALGIAVLSAGAGWEPALLPLLDDPTVGLHLVRRCVDVAELLAVATAGSVRVAIVDAGAPRVDRETVDRLRRAGVCTLLVEAARGDGRAPVDLGAADLVGADEPPATLVGRARAIATTPARGWSAAAPTPASLTPAPPAPGDPRGRLVVVWGPGGAPGRSTVAVNLATELSRRGRGVLLVDADAAGGAVGTMLGVTDDAPGVAAACRSALRGRLDPEVLAGLAVALDPGLRLLTWTSRPDRWRELRPSALAVLWDACRALADDVVVDVAPGLAGDEPDPLEPMLVGPSAATRSALEAADLVLAVGAADPLGLLRLVQGLDVLAETAATGPPDLVLNRVRAGTAGYRPRRQVREVVGRFVDTEPLAYLPDDPRATDAALRAGRALADAAPSSALRRAVQALAAALDPATGPLTRMPVGPGHGRRRRVPASTGLRSGA